VYHLFIVRSEDRGGLREHLTTEGVNTAVHYPVPIHRVGAYADLGLVAGSLPVAERLADEICTLPLFPGMSEDEMARVVQAVLTFDRRRA
jgi:dTDP-3-amino-3,4,6-trideoxy-alpha-D-glucose transaminase